MNEGAERLRMEIIWAGQRGELPDGVPADATEVELRSLAWQAVAEGRAEGIEADPHVDLDGFVVDRLEIGGATWLSVRPKTPFGP